MKGTVFLLATTTTPVLAFASKPIDVQGWVHTKPAERALFTLPPLWLPADENTPALELAHIFEAPEDHVFEAEDFFDERGKTEKRATSSQGESGGSSFVQEAATGESSVPRLQVHPWRVVKSKINELASDKTPQQAEENDSSEDSTTNPNQGISRLEISNANRYKPKSVAEKQADLRFQSDLQDLQKAATAFKKRSREWQDPETARRLRLAEKGEVKYSPFGSEDAKENAKESKDEMLNKETSSKEKSAEELLDKNKSVLDVKSALESGANKAVGNVSSAAKPVTGTDAAFSVIEALSKPLYKAASSIKSSLGAAVQQAPGASEKSAKVGEAAGKEEGDSAGASKGPASKGPSAVSRLLQTKGPPDSRGVSRVQKGSDDYADFDYAGATGHYDSQSHSDSQSTVGASDFENDSNQTNKIKGRSRVEMAHRNDIYPREFHIEARPRRNARKSAALKREEEAFNAGKAAAEAAAKRKAAVERAKAKKNRKVTYDVKDADDVKDDKDPHAVDIPIAGVDRSSGVSRLNQAGFSEITEPPPHPEHLRIRVATPFQGGEGGLEEAMNSEMDFAEKREEQWRLRNMRSGFEAGWECKRKFGKMWHECFQKMLDMQRQLHDVFAEQDDDEDGFYTTTGELFGPTPDGPNLQGLQPLPLHPIDQLPMDHMSINNGESSDPFRRGQDEWWEAPPPSPADRNGTGAIPPPQHMRMELSRLQQSSKQGQSGDDVSDDDLKSDDDETGGKRQSTLKKSLKLDQELAKRLKLGRKRKNISRLQARAQEDSSKRDGEAEDEEMFDASEDAETAASLGTTLHTQNFHSSTSSPVISKHDTVYTEEDEDDGSSQDDGDSVVSASKFESGRAEPESGRRPASRLQRKGSSLPAGTLRKAASRAPSQNSVNGHRRANEKRRTNTSRLEEQKNEKAEILQPPARRPRRKPTIFSPKRVTFQEERAKRKAQGITSIPPQDGGAPGESEKKEKKVTVEDNVEYTEEDDG